MSDTLMGGAWPYSEIASLRARAERAEADAAAMREAMLTVLGKHNVLAYAFRFIQRWGDDPAFVNPEQRKAECDRAARAVEEWKHSLCAATSSTAGAALLERLEKAEAAAKYCSTEENEK